MNHLSRLFLSNFYSADARVHLKISTHRATLQHLSANKHQRIAQNKTSSATEATATTTQLSADTSQQRQSRFRKRCLKPSSKIKLPRACTRRLWASEVSIRRRRSRLSCLISKASCQQHEHVCNRLDDRRLFSRSDSHPDRVVSFDPLAHSASDAVKTSRSTPC